MSIKLKECPFCGGRGLDCEWLKQWHVECEDCGIYGLSSDTREGAIFAWNTRHETASVDPPDIENEQIDAVSEADELMQMEIDSLRGG